MKIRVRVEEQEYEVEIEDLNQRPIIAHVGGQRFEVWPETAAPVQPSARSAPAARAETGMPTGAAGGETSVLAPLPGTVVEVQARPGSAVQIGDPLLVIEAMKMKNTIRAARAGTIAAVHVQVGQTVRHRQLLVEFDA